MKKWIYSLTATAVVLGTAAPMAYAATANGNAASSVTKATLSLNNTVVSAPGVVTKNNSVYVPVWYAMQVLKSMGIQSEWNGQSWKLTTTDGSVNTSGPSDESPSSENSIQVYINGQLAMSIPYLFATDSASHRKTAYLQIDNLNNLLQSLNVSANWDGHTWRWLTGDAKALSVAFANSDAAPHSQFTGTLDEQIQLTATDQKTAETNGMPTNLEINMKIQGSMATTDGQKSALITITSSSPAESTNASTPAVPATIQEYVQGNRIWINLGGSWQEQSASEQLLQSLKSQNPLNSMSFDAFQQIHASVNGDTTSYTATLNASSMSDTLASLLDGLAQDQMANSSSTGNDASPIPVGQMKTVLEAILQQMKGTMTITTGLVDGQSRVTGEQATIDMDLPMSTLSGMMNTAGTSGTNAAQSDSSAFGGISGMTLHETMTANYSYNDEPVTPPAGLDTTTVSANSQNTTSSGK